MINLSTEKRHDQATLRRCVVQGSDRDGFAGDFDLHIARTAADVVTHRSVDVELTWIGSSRICHCIRGLSRDLRRQGKFERIIQATSWHGDFHVAQQRCGSEEARHIRQCQSIDRDARANQRQ